MVSFSQGRVLASSAKPPQRSTTDSPSTVAVKQAPTSAPLARLAAKASRTGAYLSCVNPPTEPSALVVPPVCWESLAERANGNQSGSSKTAGVSVSVLFLFERGGDFVVTGRVVE